jgi:phosphoglycerate kinase
MAPAPVAAAASPVGIRGIDDLPLARQRVLVRADLDVPLDAHGNVTDDGKLRLLLPTLQKALSEGARVVVATHLAGNASTPPSVEPVAAKLAELLGQEVYEGQLCLLENLDFEPAEQGGDEGFARRLASLCDVFVNEAWPHALSTRSSLVALPRLMKEKGAGYRMLAELAGLGRAAAAAEKPFIGVLGGRGLLPSLEVFELMARRCDVVLVGGAAGNTLLAAKEVDMKASLVEREHLARARTILARARDQKLELVLPVDALVAKNGDASESQAVSVGSIPDQQGVFDIGPRTLELWQSRVRAAKTVLWHGALGHVENPAFAQGSRELLRALGEAPAFGVVTSSALGALARAEGPELEQKIGFVSTGGMASLAVIEGKKLPGVEALRN